MLEGGLRDLLNMNRRQDQQKTTEQEAMPKKGRQLKIPAEGISPPFTLEGGFHKYLWVGRRKTAHFGPNKLLGSLRSNWNQRQDITSSWEKC